MLFGSMGNVIIGTKSSSQDNSEILRSGEVRDVKVYVTGLKVSPKIMCLQSCRVGNQPTTLGPFGINDQGDLEDKRSFTGGTDFTIIGIKEVIYRQVID